MKLFPKKTIGASGDFSCVHIIVHWYFCLQKIKLNGKINFYGQPNIFVYIIISCMWPILGARNYVLKEYKQLNKW